MTEVPSELALADMELAVELLNEIIQYLFGLSLNVLEVEAAAS